MQWDPFTQPSQQAKYSRNMTAASRGTQEKQGAFRRQSLQGLASLGWNQSSFVILWAVFHQLHC